MSAEHSVERELKLGVWPGFELPNLDGVLNGATAGPGEQVRLQAVYYDTADLRLLRRGVTVRFRRGEDPAELWTAKLPEEAPALGLARREISVAGGASRMPTLLEDLVRGWARGAPLIPVARLRTLRRRTTLRSSTGETLALIDDDEVSIVERSRVAARFRELELELADGAPGKLLSRLADHMCSVGAQRVEQMPKVVRALGPAALAPWDLEPPELPPRPSAAELISAGLIASAGRLADHLASVVLDEDLEGVHQARVGIRRLRSDLRTTRSLLDPSVVEPLRQELDWLMCSLGEVRDLDVLLVRLRSDVDSLDPADRGAAQALVDQAAEERATAYDQLRADLRTPRCTTLLEETTVIAAGPPFVAPAAQRAAAEVLPEHVQPALRELRREAQKEGKTPADEGLHRLRILVKRLRYAVELAAPVAGEPARRAARGLTRVQDVLGDYNDACTAVARLRVLGQRTGAENAWVAGLLGGLQVARMAECRQRFKSVWADALGAKRWRWVE